MHSFSLSLSGSLSSIETLSRRQGHRINVLSLFLSVARVRLAKKSAGKMLSEVLKVPPFRSQHSFKRHMYENKLARRKNAVGW